MGKSEQDKNEIILALDERRVSLVLSLRNNILWRVTVNFPAGKYNLDVYCLLYMNNT